MYDYFYGAEAEQFSFYRIPKVLFTEERFRSVSAEAKVLYGLLLDRMSLSCKNGWLDKEGRVYIIFTIEEVMTALGCADQKAGKLLHELESKCRLIERKRQGLGKPNLIYVKNFVDNHVDNLCITACITYADIHTIGVRGAQGGISTEKLDSFQQVFHTFIWSKDINLLTLQDIRRWCITTFTVVIQPINIRHRCV